MGKYVDTMVKKQNNPTKKAPVKTADLANEMKKWGLVERDLQIIKLIANGKSAREIGEVLHLSQKTIEAEKKKIAEKFGVKGGTGIVVKAFENKLIN